MNCANQLQPIRIGRLGVFHDSVVCHPFRHGGKIERVNAPEDSGEFEDIRVRQGIPEDNLSAKSLNTMFKQRCNEKANFQFTSLIFSTSVVVVILGVLIAIVELFKVPRRTSQNPPDVCRFSSAIVFSAIMMESGSLLRRLTNSMSTMRSDCLVGWSSECLFSPYGIFSVG